ncbi:MAG TPA: carbon-nitrogen hydrolase family protein [Polyangiales bacterium]|jgi:predicted amidohydrolase|nr:carbon-nitrogen hydrolase family protein [Polyangiales bacterium]
MAKDELVVAAAQLNSQADVARNLETCRALVERAKRRGAEVVLLPENFAFFGPESDKRQVAESLSEGAISRAIRDMAREHALAVIGGGFPERTADTARPHNTLLAVGPDGKDLATYRKIHLFDVQLGSAGSYAESDATSAGAEIAVAEVGGFKLGLSICYDLRFPELYRALSDRGAEVLLVPAAFTLHTGKDHWHVLLRARAIEAQAFVVAAAQQGSHPGNRQTYGHSLVVDPWGTVIAEAADGVGLVTATLERARLDSVRRSLPSLTHRKLGMARP